MIDKACTPIDWSDLDEHIIPFVQILREHGVETCQSCQGGKGHAYQFPTIEFVGSFPEALKALACALEHGFNVHELQCSYHLSYGQLDRPIWALILQSFPESPPAGEPQEGGN